MSKAERLMLLEIYKYSNCVPNFRNNTDMASHASHRADHVQLSHLMSELTYALLMYGTLGEDKNLWQEEFEARLSELKSFVEFRKSESWKPETAYSYTVAIGGW